MKVTAFEAWTELRSLIYARSGLKRSRWCGILTLRVFHWEDLIGRGRRPWFQGDEVNSNGGLSWLKRATPNYRLQGFT